MKLSLGWIGDFVDLPDFSNLGTIDKIVES